MAEQLITRRGAIGLLLAAPAIVRPSILMRCAGVRIAPRSDEDMFMDMVREHMVASAYFESFPISPCRLLIGGVAHSFIAGDGITLSIADPG